MPEKRPIVAVGIPTFRRPESLRRLLRALADVQADAILHVIVADNDGKNHQGFDLVQQMSGYRWPLTGELVVERGITAARNALVARALSGPCDFLAMIDDDEWPDTGWISGFLAMQGTTKADALGGSIRFERPLEAGWAAGFDGVSTIERPDGPISMLEGAGNIFLTRALLESLSPPWFDPVFGLSGGEDRDFFERLKRAGFCFAWARNALAFAEVPQTRVTLKWVLVRAFRIGNAEMRIFRKYRPDLLSWLREGAKMLLALLSMPLLSAILIFSPNRAADALRRWFRNLGKLAALMGRRHNEYAAPHGE